VVQSQVPGPRPSHGETTEHDSTLVDLEPPLHRVDGLENVGLACPAVGVVGPAEDVQDNLLFLIGRGGLAVVRLDEVHLGQGGPSAVQDHVEPDALGGAIALLLVHHAFGHDHGEGLNRAVDPGEVPSNRRARRRFPGAFALGELMGPLEATVDGL